jgi:hypothetical protein
MRREQGGGGGDAQTGRDLCALSMSRNRLSVGELMEGTATASCFIGQTRSSVNACVSWKFGVPFS